MYLPTSIEEGPSFYAVELAELRKDHEWLESHGRWAALLAVQLRLAAVAGFLISPGVH